MTSPIHAVLANRLRVYLSILAVLAAYAVMGLPVDASSPDGLKPPVVGLMNMGGIAPPEYVPVVRGAVVGVDWAAMQPTAFGPLAADNPLDRAISRVRKWNAAHPSSQVAVKVRLFAGIDSPNWVKQLSGGPVAVSAYGRAGTVPRFWTTPVQKAYADLMTKLAASYDDVLEVREFTNTLCTTIWGEPMVRQGGVIGTRMLAAGYTTAADDGCQRAGFRAATAFKRTRVATSFSVYHRLDPDGRIRQDLTYAEAMMDFCRTTLGPQCVLGSNELGRVRPPEGRARYNALFAHMKALGGPIYFQMDTSAHASDPTPRGYLSALAEAVDFGAVGVELYQTYKQWSPLSPAALAPYSVGLQANATR